MMEYSVVLLRVWVHPIVYISINPNAVITPLPYNPLCLEVPVVFGGFTLLGSPIGPSVFGKEFVLRRANKLKWEK